MEEATGLAVAMGSGNQAADTVVQTTGQTTQRSGQHAERDWIFHLGAREGWSEPIQGVPAGGFPFPNRHYRLPTGHNSPETKNLKMLKLPATCFTRINLIPQHLL